MTDGGCAPRLRALLTALSRIGQAEDETALAHLAASLAGDLFDADRVVIAIERRGVLQVVGEHGAATAGTDDAWRRPIAEPSASFGSPAPVIACPLRAPGVAGVLYADRLRRGSPYQDEDAALAEVFASYLALAIARLRTLRVGNAPRLSPTRARYGFPDIVGSSPSLEVGVAMAKRAADLDSTVLITGESGTGKEVMAQAIHASGPRANGPFVGINCAAIPRELLEAELFGYERGAFTGAHADGKVGKFELAAEGTILLDEIGDMPLDMQAKLLRVLEERTLTRLGGTTETRMSARVIATTHRDLDRLVDQGSFRADLLYRLRVLAIELPPLRERREDIAPLALFHLRRFADQQRKRARDLGPSVIEELERYDWPGNVRELANVMEAEVSLTAPDVDVVKRLATRLATRFRTPGAPTTGEMKPFRPQALPPDEGVLPLAEVEKRAFLQALEKLQSVSRAAEALGVSKVTFYAKLRAWGLHPKGRDGDEPPSSGR